MIDVEGLKSCYLKLFTYDVVQGAWEQELHGFEANASHVLTHLTKDLINKNFTDQEVVTSAIAPDAIQYALRLVRWSGDINSVADLAERAEEGGRWVVEGLGNMPSNAAAWLKGSGRLASNLHDLGHVRTREQATERRIEDMQAAGRMLMVCANVSAENYGFDLAEAFDDRLAALRYRFGIPTPD